MKSKLTALALAIILILSSLAACVIPPPVVESISVTTMPTKIQYELSETADYTGGQITAILSDGSDRIVSMTDSEVNVTGFSSDTVGQKLLTVTYGGKDAVFYVKIGRSLESISVTKNPKTEYELWDTDDYTGGEITALYDDGREQVIPMTDDDVSISGFSSDTVGQKPLIVEYGGKSTTLYISVGLPHNVAKATEAIREAAKGATEFRNAGYISYFVCFYNRIKPALDSLTAAEKELFETLAYDEAETFYEVYDGLKLLYLSVSYFLPAAGNLLDFYYYFLDTLYLYVTDLNFSAGSEAFDTAVETLQDGFRSFDLDTQLEFLILEETYYISLLTDYYFDRLSYAEYTLWTALIDTMFYFLSFQYGYQSAANFLYMTDAIEKLHGELPDKTVFDGYFGEEYNYYITMRNLYDDMPRAVIDICFAIDETLQGSAAVASFGDYTLLVLGYRKMDKAINNMTQEEKDLYYEAFIYKGVSIKTAHDRYAMFVEMLFEDLSPIEAAMFENYLEYAEKWIAAGGSIAVEGTLFIKSQYNGNFDADILAMKADFLAADTDTKFNFLRVCELSYQFMLRDYYKSYLTESEKDVWFYMHLALLDYLCGNMLQFAGYMKNCIDEFEKLSESSQANFMQYVGDDYSYYLSIYESLKT